MHSNFLRRQHIHGVLAGAAVGDALGFPRNGLSRRALAAIYGQPKLHYQSVLGGAYSTDTHLLFMTAQALLNSRSDLRNFRRAFRNRLSWYPLSLPMCSRSTLNSAARSWLARFGVSSGVYADNNAAATTAIFSTLAMHGTGHRLEKWVEDTTRLTLTHPMVIDGCKVLSRVTELAALAKGEPLAHDDVLEVALQGVAELELRSKLESLAKHLDAGHSPAEVADALGWKTHISSSMLPTTVMGLYCWLRSPSNFEEAVLPAIALGGDASSLGGVTGALVGAYAKFGAVPTVLYKALGGTPHGPEWIDALGERFSHWPHGEHDLHLAPAQTSDPPMQLIRNIFAVGRLAANRIGRWPRRAAGSSST